MSKMWYLKVTLILYNKIEADTKEEAIEILKEAFAQDNNIELSDKEITVLNDFYEIEEKQQEE